MRDKDYKCFNIKCGSCIGKTLCGEPADTALGCANRLVSLGAKQATTKQATIKQATSKWISVEERLPKKEGSYLTYTDKERIHIDSFCIYPEHGTKFWVGGNGAVTHWMPLPMPQKEGV